MWMSLQQWKMLYGFALLVVLSILAFSVALGKIHDMSSFGPIITMLSTLAGAFAQWAFTTREQPPETSAAPKAAHPVPEAKELRAPDLPAGSPGA